jgi:hypothetical protein
MSITVEDTSSIRELHENSIDHGRPALVLDRNR